MAVSLKIRALPVSAPVPDEAKPISGSRALTPGPRSLVPKRRRPSNRTPLPAGEEAKRRAQGNGSIVFEIPLFVIVYLKLPLPVDSTFRVRVIGPIRLTGLSLSLHGQWKR